MPTYAIGDIQGCFSALEKLLALIHFDEKVDTLWFVGDLVNRGPQSLEVLRFVKSLGDKHKTVLGNHDLHLLAVAYGVRKSDQEDTLDVILAATERDELIEWLRHRPLLVYDPTSTFVMTHAGLAPSWNLSQAMSYAREVEMILQSHDVKFLLQNMYGAQPDHWQDTLSGIERLRCIINYFTRMRFCYADGRMELNYKGTIKDKPKDLIPWFEVTPRANTTLKIIFGHWAALNGQTNVPNLYALDTGCVWGNCLTAFCLEHQQRFQVKC